MSLYNMLFGVTPVAFFILPMLGHHPDEYPRFRDCFLRDEDHPEYDGYIQVYTRTGGGNREDYEGEHEWMRAMPEYVADFDDSFDCTYATFVFCVPERWREDFNKVHAGRIQETSTEYQQLLYDTFPKLKERWDEIFKLDPRVLEGSPS